MAAACPASSSAAPFDCEVVVSTFTAAWVAAGIKTCRVTLAQPSWYLAKFKDRSSR
jgi:hypothetical protein